MAYQKKALQQHFYRQVVMREADGHQKQVTVKWPCTAISVPMLQRPVLRWRGDAGVYRATPPLVVGMDVYKWDGQRTTVQGLPVFQA